jgi:hypothetical protein
MTGAFPASSIGSLSLPGRLLSATQENVEGTWILQMNTGATRIEGALEIEQDGPAIEGTWLRHGDTRAMPTPMSGEVAADTLTFSFVDEVTVGTRGQIDFVGEIGEQGVMSGTFTTKDGTTGEWTARRN